MSNIGGYKTPAPSRVESPDRNINPQVSPTRRDLQIRAKLLNKVKREVNSRIEQSLHHAVLTTLPTELRSPQIERSWDAEVKIGNRPIFQLPKSTSLTRVFEQSGGRLLIFGSVGSGKTTTLLELGKELIEKAENNASIPIPVLFNVLTWKDKYSTLVEWLVAELESNYGIPNNFSKQLIENHQIIPLIDGLDELNLTRQERCIRAINELLQQNHRQPYLVVCIRLEDYKICTAKLRLNGAIFLRPLNENQIREYLLSARSRELWEDIKTDPAILALAKTPLLLCMMTLAYEEISIRAWKSFNSVEERRRYLLGAYVRRMLVREIKQKYYAKGKEPLPEKTRYWLVWLAKKMKSEATDELNLHLWFHGLAGIKNLKERFILWRQGYIPWNYSRFLNYASDRLLLQKFDGRYRFTHKLLREHFAQIVLHLRF